MDRSLNLDCPLTMRMHLRFHTVRAKSFGGSPEGYILPEQLDWIRRELKSGETDATVRYIVLLAQEPVFPAGGHSGDAMWYSGNNNVRAYKRDETGEVAPFADGIIDVRNKLWTMISNAKKVALVLGSDEHNYQRMLIDSKTPVGVLSDDSNNDGILNDGRYHRIPISDIQPGSLSAAEPAHHTTRVKTPPGVQRPLRNSRHATITWLFVHRNPGLDWKCTATTEN
jgi:3',5'-cyclic AMP phosphodiesterase CpdA